MQTILGANGQIATELAKELNRNYTTALRLVSRSPQKVNETDQLFQADLLDPVATAEAVKGSSIAYLTVGLPADTQMWQEQFPRFMENTIRACIQHNTRLVFFDNTYMYPQNSTPLTEETPFAPVGEKGKVRAAIAQALLQAIANQKLQAVICRAPEFYGPDKTKGITTTLIFENFARGKKLKVPLRDDKFRTLIWTPDASKATALIGNTPNAYQQTWHLACDDNRLTYKQWIGQIATISGKNIEYEVVEKQDFEAASRVNAQTKELLEMLPRYEHDNLFVSDKFKDRFPDFLVTRYEEGIRTLLDQIQQTAPV